MKKSSILSIPIAYQQQIYQIEIYPFDTPLQIAYRFCTQQHLEFNFISPLSKQIISYVQMVLDSQSIDQSTKMQIQLHFDKFINNATIRESIKIVDTSIKIHNNCIQIQSNDEKFDFSFDNKEDVVDQFQFSFKNKLQDLLNPQTSSRAEIYVKNNTVQQIEHLQKQEKMNQKILNRLQNKSQRGIPYSEYMSFHSTRRGSSNIQQSPIQSPEKLEQNTIQTLPKVSFENTRNISPQEISFSQQQIDQSSSVNGTLCNSRVERSTKQDRMKSFKELMNKLQCISTPQKRNYEIMIKQQNNAIEKTVTNIHYDQEQKINEVFVLLDYDKDGYIDHGVNLQQLKEHIIELFEPVWFQILWKKVKVNKRQFQEMMQKRIKDLDQQELGKFIFNGIKK